MPEVTSCDCILSASLVKWSESSYHFAVGYGYGGDETAIRRPDYWQEDHPRLRKDLWMQSSCEEETRNLKVGERVESS